MDLAQACDVWAGIPLLFQPGTEWNYSVATDVLGRVIEVVSGQRLDEFLAARILRPLGMTDTGFYAGDTQLPRLAALYTPGSGGTAARLDALGDAARHAPAMLGGGGGLVCGSLCTRHSPAEEARPGRIRPRSAGCLAVSRQARPVAAHAVALISAGPAGSWRRHWSRSAARPSGGSDAR
jgi:CubicO group peptidase (beta-lactamase class C family)